MRKSTLLLLVLAVAAPAQDTDAGRGVARLSLLNGDVSVRRGDSGDWTAAAVNAPLVVEDRVQTGPNSRAEIQFDWANILRVAGQSEVRMRELSEKRYLLEMANGLATMTVLRDSEADFDLSTPAVSVRPVKRGVYRVEVLGDGTTEIGVKSGEAEVYTPRGTQRLRNGESMQVRGSGDPEFQISRVRGDDDWDRWNRNRNQDLERSASYRYVHRSVYGADDLDGYGAWEDYPEYGRVWVPRVATGWAPYRYGRWSWVDYYGWSWVSYDPWGWAPFHYGRWFYARNRWCWYPGGIYTRSYWSPGLVAFFGWGGGGVGVGVGGGWGRVGWVPLAPFERYNPWYGRGFYGGYRNRTYVDNSVNIVNNVNITNVYRNARVNNSITGIDADGFSRGRQGGRFDGADLRQAQLTRGLVPVSPTRDSARFSDRDVRGGGGNSRFDRNDGQNRFVARQAPRQVERASFDEQRRGVESSVRGGRLAGEGGSGRVARDGLTRPEQRAEGVRGGESPRVDRLGGDARSGDARSGRFGDGQGMRNGLTPEARAEAGQPVRPADSGGWRRFGEPRANDRETRGSDVRGNAPRVDPGAGVNRNPESSGGGWRRFGEPRATEGAVDRGSDGGRRLGDSAPPVDRGARDRGTVDRGAIDRGTIDRGTVDRNSGDRGSFGADRPQLERRSEPRQVERFGGSRPESQPRQRIESPRIERSQPRVDRGDSVRMAPPIVRERSSSPRMERSAPRMEQRSAPRMERSAPSGGGGGPRGSGGGGGGRSQSRGGGGRSR